MKFIQKKKAFAMNLNFFPICMNVSIQMIGSSVFQSFTCFYDPTYIDNG